MLGTTSRRGASSPGRRATWTAGMALVGVGLWLVAGCGVGTSRQVIATRQPDGTTVAAVRVVATTTQVADFARVIGGGCADVHGILRPNVDPHDYEASPADIDAVARAEVIVRNGVGLDGWLDQTMHDASPHAAVIDASRGVTIRSGPDGSPDPHIWHDPRNAEQMVATIEAALVAARPACAASFDANLRDYTGRLASLDRDNAAALATLDHPKLVTNHDAFGYYVARYGIDFVGSIIPSFDSSAELSGTQVDDLVSRIRAQGVKAVFSEASLPGRTAQTIAREAGVEVVQGDGALYGDSLGPAGSPGATYLTMEAHNTATIVANLR